MADLQGFNASTVEPRKAFELIPAGKYDAVIAASERRRNKAGTGQYLELVFQIIDGEAAGRRLWVRLNLEHPNQTAVEIARADLSAICRAVGVLAPSDSADLHNIPLVIRVRIKKRKDTGEDTSEIVGYEPVSAVPAAPVPSMPPTMATSAPFAVPPIPPPPSCLASAVPPWQRA